MAININADTTNGLVITSDNSGEINLQNAGSTVATINSSGLTMASGMALSGVSTGFSNMQVFTTDGTFDATNVDKVKVTIIGAGGSGGGATSGLFGQGGAAGGAAIKFIDTSAASTISVTVGTGGTGPSSGNGASGGTSSFGSYCSASGGGGGLGNLDRTPGASTTYNAPNAGIGTDGDLNLEGGRGFPFQAVNVTTDQYSGGMGGAAPLGFGFATMDTFAGGNSVVYAGEDGRGYGSGGNGGWSAAGGSGANGLVIVEY